MQLNLLLTSVLVLSAVAVSAQVSSNVHRSQSSRHFHANAASLAESVDADGSKWGECAYYDSDGQQIKVRFSQYPGSTARYTITEGNSQFSAAEAYNQCVEQSRRSQQSNAYAFRQTAGVFNQFAHAPFTPFFAGGVDHQFAAGGAAGPFVRSEDNAGNLGSVVAVGGPIPQPAVNDIAATIQNQMRAAQAMQHQIQDNVFQMQQHSLSMHNRLMQQHFGG